MACSCLTITTVPISDLETPFENLVEMNPGIEGYVGSAIIVANLDDQPCRILSLQRPDGCSFPGVWETSGGSWESTDENSIATTIREVYEETGLELAYAADIAYQHIYVRRNGERTIRYTSITTMKKVPICGRRWNHGENQPYGSDKGLLTLSDEHKDYCWLSEDDIKKAIPFDPTIDSQTGLIIRKDEIEIYTMFFQRVRERKLLINHPL